MLRTVAVVLLQPYDLIELVFLVAGRLLRDPSEADDCSLFCFNTSVESTGY